MRRSKTDRKTAAKRAECVPASSFFFSTCSLQNTAELHPFVIPCGILVLFCHVILIFLPLLCVSVKHVFVCLHCSPSSPGPRYTQDFHLVGKQCVHNRNSNSSRAGFCPEMNSAAAVVRAAHC